jgi:hypothetical protein
MPTPYFGRVVVYLGNRHPEIGLAQRVGGLLAHKLRLLHLQNPPLKAASILPDFSHSNWRHLQGQCHFRRPAQLTRVFAAYRF